MINEVKKLWKDVDSLPDSPEKQQCLEDKKKFIFALELSMYIFEHNYKPADFLRSDIFTE